MYVRTQDTAANKYVWYTSEPSRLIRPRDPLATCHSDFTLDHFSSNMSAMYPTQYRIFFTDSMVLIADQARRLFTFSL
jgi:hypothetical protein